MLAEGPKINRDLMVQQLHEAVDAIIELEREAVSGKWDRCNAVDLSYRYMDILSHLCFAWHSRLLSNDEFDDLDHDAFSAANFSIPNWGLSFRLVELDDDVVQQFVQRRASCSDNGAMPSHKQTEAMDTPPESNRPVS